MFAPYIADISAHAIKTQDLTALSVLPEVVLIMN